MKFERQLIGERSTGRTSALVRDVLRWVANDNQAIIVASTQTEADRLRNECCLMMPGRHRSRIAARSSQRIPSGYTAGMKEDVRVFVDHSVMDRILEQTYAELSNKLCQGNDKISIDIQ